MFILSIASYCSNWEDELANMKQSQNVFMNSVRGLRGQRTTDRGNLNLICNRMKDPNNHKNNHTIDATSAAFIFTKNYSLILQFNINLPFRHQH